jgi:hypothetical protein
VGYNHLVNLDKLWDHLDQAPRGTTGRRSPGRDHPGPGRRADQPAHSDQGPRKPAAKSITAPRSCLSTAHRKVTTLTLPDWGLPPRQPLGRRPLPTRPSTTPRPPPRGPRPGPRLAPRHLAVLARPRPLRPHQTPSPTTSPHTGRLTQGYSSADPSVGSGMCRQSCRIEQQRPPVRGRPALGPGLRWPAWVQMYPSWTRARLLRSSC